MSAMSASRRAVHFNPSARDWNSSPASPSADLIDKFHRELPSYSPTPLISLRHIAQELGVKEVHVKNESLRFGLPSFKILGASWGVFRAITQRLGLPLDTSLEALKQASSSHHITLYAATDGNHGRAVARMGALLSIPAHIYVPVSMYQATIDLIQSEGATVRISKGSYDDAVLEARAASEHDGGVLIQDFAFEGYEDIPQWVVDGYGTMVREIDSQLGPRSADFIVAPVGVGSLAQAVVAHYKQPGRSTSVLAVEPDTAACLWKSLKRGELTPELTIPTIMAGLDCGTPSSIAWPFLKNGIDASVTVSDYEAHQQSLFLQSLDVSSGPCGAAPLAALRRLSDSDKATLGLNSDSIIVLLCTEGPRQYTIPRDVSVEDPALLTQMLVQINSASPTLGSVPGPGETAIARYIAAWLAHRDIETHWIEPTAGRPSIVGVARGSGGGKSLMFNGHIDTVTLMGYDGDALSGTIADGKLYGRGAADMKCGIAAALCATLEAKNLNLRGDVIFTGVADEEDKSIGTEDVLAAGWRADAAIVSEPVNLEIVNEHKGFVWLQVGIHGVASHGSRPDLGVDAISKAGYFLVELDKYAQELAERKGREGMGSPSVHASLVKGGEEASSYPAHCTITLERRTLPTETPEAITSEITTILDDLSQKVPDFKYSIRELFRRPAFTLSKEDQFTKLVTEIVSKRMGKAVKVTGGTFWTDCALLSEKGIPSLLWGPLGEGLHAKEEWVDVESVKVVAEALTTLAAEFCK